MLYEAVFKPSEQMNYNEEALKLADTRIPVYEGWIVKEGPFKGEQCFYIPNTNIGWIPSSDLDQLKPISAVQWHELHKIAGFAS